jgi:hypothetical protein
MKTPFIKKNRFLLAKNCVTDIVSKFFGPGQKGDNKRVIISCTLFINLL